MDSERFALLDKKAVTLQTDVKIGRMDQQAGVGCPRLAVYVSDARLGENYRRSRRIHGIKVDEQAMLAVLIGLAGKLFRDFRVGSVDSFPPGSPYPKGVLAAIRRREVGCLRTDCPFAFGTRQATSGKVIRRH